MKKAWEVIKKSFGKCLKYFFTKLLSALCDAFQNTCSLNVFIVAVII